MRLSPPPKVVSRDGRAPTTGRPVAGRSRAGYWATALVFAALIAVAVGVFVFLPGWVADRSARAEETPQAATTVTEESPAPSTSPSTPSAPLPEGSRGPSGGSEEPRELARTETRGLERQAAGAAPAETGPKGPSRIIAAAPTPSPPNQANRAAFGRAMAAGLDALERGELPAARDAFERAAELSPGAAEAADGLARVGAAEQLAVIAAHRDRAESLEAKEDWEGALAEYAAVLELDPAIRFATQGRDRASQRLELVREMDAHLERPDRLASDEVLEEARDVLDRARAIDPPGPRLADRIERLERRISIASTPVRVVLVSDGLTEVLVYRVGRIGRFERREVDLRPGVYTVVGSREGYRDVRYQIEVSPEGTEPLTVRCEEKI